MTKIDEIRERAEKTKEDAAKLFCGTWQTINPQDVINLCDALKEATKYVNKRKNPYNKKPPYIVLDTEASDTLSRIEHILKRGTDASSNAKSS